MADGDSPLDWTSETNEDQVDISEGGSSSSGRDGITPAYILTLLLMVVFVIALAGVVYIALTPQQATDPYTEFYILGSEGNASDYPTNLTVGEEGTVLVGVVNHEHREKRYTIEVRAENQTLTTRTIDVEDEERWEEPVTYSLEEPGRVRVRFLLFDQRDPTPETPPYRSLRLWTNISSSS